MGHVEITTIIPCSNMCKFCPQEVLSSVYKDNTELSFNDFKRILQKIPKDYSIHFSGFSEPFLNRDSSKMIRFAYESGYKISLFSTLVGITEEDIEIIKDVIFDGITIHVPDDRNFVVYDTKEWIYNYYLFIAEFKINSASYYIGEVDELIKLTCSNIRKASEGCLTSRCNNVNSNIVLHVDRIKGDIRCIASGRTPVVLPNGDVVVCCMDWEMKHKTGNLFTDDFEDLFTSREFMNVKQSWTDESVDSICRYCKR